MPTNNLCHISCIFHKVTNIKLIFKSHTIISTLENQTPNEKNLSKSSRNPSITPEFQLDVWDQMEEPNINSNCIVTWTFNFCLFC